MKITLLLTLLILVLTPFAYGSGAITIEVKTTDSKTGYVLHKHGYGEDSKSASIEEIQTWLRFIIPKISDPKLRIFIYTDDRTPFVEIIKLLRHMKAAGVAHFVVCSGVGAEVQPQLSADLADVKIDFPWFGEKKKINEKIGQSAAANP